MGASVNAPASAPNCAGPGSYVSAGYNQTDISPAQCGFSAATDSVALTLLGPLQDNGGPVPTHALLTGSKAIDAIPLSACTDQSPSPAPVTVDARGVTRGLDGACDIGAFEYAPVAVTISATSSATTLAVGQQTTLTFIASNNGPAPAVNPTLTLVANNLTLLSDTPTQGTCGTAGGPSVICYLGVIAAGASVKVTVPAQATPGALNVTGTVQTNEPNLTQSRAAVLTIGGPPSSSPSPTPGPGHQVPPTAATRPSISHVTQSHRTWQRGNTLASLAKHRPPVGTTFSFVLNGSATVSLVFTRQRPGRDVHNQCLAPTKKNRHHPVCQRIAVAGSLKSLAHAGINMIVFDGRLSRSTALAPGRYRLLITASNSAGHAAGAPLTFTIVK